MIIDSFASELEKLAQRPGMSQGELVVHQLAQKLHRQVGGADPATLLAPARTQALQERLAAHPVLEWLAKVLGRGEAGAVPSGPVIGDIPALERVVQVAPPLTRDGAVVRELGNQLLRAEGRIGR